MNVTVIYTPDIDAGAAEYRERDRLWRQHHRETDPTARQKDRDYSQAYYQKNSEIINKKSSEYQKKKRTDQPEEVRAKAREQYKRRVALHKDDEKIKPVSHLCECGGNYTPSHKSGHVRSKRHLRFCGTLA
jgi:hypothetical protein